MAPQGPLMIAPACGVVRARALPAVVARCVALPAPVATSGGVTTARVTSGDRGLAGASAGPGTTVVVTVALGRVATAMSDVRMVVAVMRAPARPAAVTIVAVVAMAVVAMIGGAALGCETPAAARAAARGQSLVAR